MSEQEALKRPCSRCGEQESTMCARCRHECIDEAVRVARKEERATPPATHTVEEAVEKIVPYIQTMVDLMCRGEVFATDRIRGDLRSTLTTLIQSERAEALRGVKRELDCSQQRPGESRETQIHRIIVIAIAKAEKGE